MHKIENTKNFDQESSPSIPESSDEGFLSASVEALTSESSVDEAMGPKLSEQAFSPETHKYLTAYIQLQADFENYKKRVQREREELIKSATRALMEELLTILDHLNLALQSAHPEDEKGYQIVQGFAMTIDHLKKLLGARGLSEIGKLGEKFNPHIHEAVGQTTHSEVPSDHICQLIRSGYQLYDLVLRPASVVISTGLAPNPEVNHQIL